MANTELQSITRDIVKHPARVFLFEPVKQRLQDVSRYGKIEYMFPKDSERASIWDTDTMSDDVIESLEKADYSPEIDFIAITGHLVPLAVMIAAVTNEYGKFRALLFDARDHSYCERMLG